MRPLETADAGWIDDLAAVVRELQDLSEFMYRELERDEQKYGARTSPYGYGSAGSNANPWEKHYGVNPDSHYNYRGPTSARYYEMMRNAHGKASYVLDIYRHHMRNL